MLRGNLTFLKICSQMTFMKTSKRGLYIYIFYECACMLIEAILSI